MILENALKHAYNMHWNIGYLSYVGLPLLAHFIMQYGKIMKVFSYWETVML